MTSETPTILLGMRWFELISILAILVGPILAVIVTRIQDRRTESHRRRLEIFRSLMKTRQSQLDPEHVGALNLIELEFYGTSHIVEAYRNYMAHLHSPLPSEGEQSRYFENRHDLYVKMIHLIGKHLGFEFDKHDLGRFGYAPDGWGYDQARQRRNSALLTELLEGRRSLPVFQLQGSSGLFPPPPDKAHE